MLQTVLNDEIRRRRLSIRQAAREIGFSHTTLNRLLDGSPYDLDTLQKVSAWSGVDLAALLKVDLGGSHELADQIAVLFDLSPRFREAIEEVVAQTNVGTIRPDILDQTAIFIIFQIRLSVNEE